MENKNAAIMSREPVTVLELDAAERNDIEIFQLISGIQESRIVQPHLDFGIGIWTLVATSAFIKKSVYPTKVKK